MYVCMYVCMYTSTYTHTYKYIHQSVWKCICINTDMYIYIYQYLSVCTNMCIYICVLSNMCFVFIASMWFQPGFVQKQCPLITGVVAILLTSQHNVSGCNNHFCYILMV